MKSTRASRPVPTWWRVSSVMLSAFSCQELSRAGQVVNMTFRRRITPWGVRFISWAAPRAARWRSANSADLTSALTYDHVPLERHAVVGAECRRVTVEGDVALAP